MELAEKLLRLRKQKGWSQEELAAEMNVSRQAVSKWESAQAVPDLDKLVQLSRLFGVTTDHLLKDEVEAAPEGAAAPLRQVTLAQAQAFLRGREAASGQMAAAVFLCVIAVIPLLLLAAAVEASALPIGGNAAAAMGLGALFVLVAIAAALFLGCGFRHAPYAFMEREPFATAPGVAALVRERQAAFRPAYGRCSILAAVLCILAPVPLLAGALTGDDFFLVCMLAVTLLLAGAGAGLFTLVGVRWASMQKLLQEGDYAPKAVRKSRLKEPIANAYWLIATAAYLAWSFATDDWERTWILWPVAGVLFAGVMALCNLLPERKE